MKKIFLLSFLNVIMVITAMAGNTSTKEIISNEVANTRYALADINLHYGPSECDSIMMVIPKGTPVTIDDDCDCEWVPVEYRGEIGFISTKDLSHIQPNENHLQNNPDSEENTTGTTQVQDSPTALCNDGTYSYSKHRKGTCSRHGGVKKWLKKVPA